MVQIFFKFKLSRNFLIYRLVFRGLDKDIEGSAKRWKKFVETECPEREKLPQEWKNKTALQKLCIMRALRPDRMTHAIRYNFCKIWYKDEFYKIFKELIRNLNSCFVEEKLGPKYVEAKNSDLSDTLKKMNSTTPVFFILSPGVDPTRVCASVFWIVVTKLIKLMITAHILGRRSPWKWSWLYNRGWQFSQRFTGTGAGGHCWASYWNRLK